MADRKASILEVLSDGDIVFDGKTILSSDILDDSSVCESVPNSGKRVSSIEDDAMSELSGSVPLSIFSKFKKPKHEKLVTLPTTDIRLTYAEKFFKSMNACDANEVGIVLNDIALPNMCFVSKQVKTHTIIPKHLEFVGIEVVTNFMKLFFQAIPDLIVELHSEKIYMYANGESCIECLYQVFGTKMLQITGLKEGSDDKVIVKSEIGEISDGIGNMKVQSKVVADVESTDGIHQQVPVSLGTQQRVSFTNQSSLTMHLNVQNKVYLMIHSIQE